MTDAGWLDLLKIWGPLALGWPIAYMIGRELLTLMKEQRETYKADIESRVKLANSLDGLRQTIERVANAKPS